jgi:hypothetical protein
MSKVYVIAEFKLNEGVEISEWKKMSDNIDSQMT